MTCNDVEPNCRIGKRFKSLTSKNLIKYLILTSYKPNMRFYRITSKVVLFVKLSKISLSATFLAGARYLYGGCLDCPAPRRC